MFKKIFITGARGMVGSNLVETLKNSNNLELITPSRKELDLQNYAQVEKFIQGTNPDIIIHCAGKVGGIQANMDAPFSFLSENLDMGRNLIMAAFKCQIKSMINLASSCMYPRNLETPLTEDLILTGELEPTNEGYALAKIMALKLCMAINQENSEFNYKTLIPCNLYGKYDKFSAKKSHLIPAVIRKIDEAIKTQVNQVSIWGDGQSRREFMYAEDLCNFILFAINNFQEIPQVMNVGIGDDYSIEDYYRIIGKIMGYNGNYTFDTSKPAGMRRKLVSVEKQENLNWSPKHSLENGVQKTIDYYRQEVLHEH
ncbi:GDP-L-fucose synthase [Bacteriovoracaceae bacterium]|nr:GDP-L-fucose synthase [Bacteriovoracaceae bacterium]